MTTAPQPDPAPPTAEEEGWPAVSIVLPTLNERDHIDDCLDSLAAQSYPAIAEILVVDGGSSDGTRDRVVQRGGLVRLVDNPAVTAAAAMNTGLGAASCDLVVRADAHTRYASDYVLRSVEALRESGADWVGGRMDPVAETPFGRAVAAVTSSPLGVGPGRFHYSTEAADVETVYLGTFDRRTVWAVGGYDQERLQWAAEDQELAFRLRRAGRRIRFDPRIRSSYSPRDTPRRLWDQYWNYGVCKASTLKKHHVLPYWRPLVPAAMVAGTVAWMAGAVAARRPRLTIAPLAVYGVGVLGVAPRLAEGHRAPRRLVMLALVICHWAYGFGFWSGMVRILSGRPFDSRPRGHR